MFERADMTEPCSTMSWYRISVSVLSSIDDRWQWNELIPNGKHGFAWVHHPSFSGEYINYEFIVIPLEQTKEKKNSQYQPNPSQVTTRGTLSKPTHLWLRKQIQYESTNRAASEPSKCYLSVSLSWASQHQRSTTSPPNTHSKQAYSKTKRYNRSTRKKIQIIRIWFGSETAQQPL